MENNENVIEVEITKEAEDKIKRKANLIKDIVVHSSKEVLDDKRLYQGAAAVALFQGLTRGSLGKGVTAGVATVGATIGANVVWKLYKHSDEIKNA